MKIYEFARIHQGHQITDEEIYLTDNNTYPIYTARNSIKGYWDKTMIKDSEIPCLTYPTKGNAGDIFLQSELFDANNTAALILKEEFKEKINLEWLLYKLRPLFLQFQTSKGGVSYLNKDIVENIEISIPNKKIQLNELKELKKLELLKSKVEHIINAIDNIITKNILVQYKEFQSKDVPVHSLFLIESGNNNLTEKTIYESSSNIKELISVYSSATSTNSQMPKTNKSMIINNQNIKYFSRNKKYIIISRNGKQVL